MSSNTWRDLYGADTDEILGEYEENILNGLEDYNNAWGENSQILTNATYRDDGSERNIATSLDDYDKTQRNVTQGLADQNDAIANKTDSQMNTYQHVVTPVVEDAVSKSAASRMFGNGDSVNRAMNNANASQYETAQTQAQNIGNNNSTAYATQSGLAESKLEADATPQQDWLAMYNDNTATNLETAYQLATNRANAESADNGTVGNVINTISGIYQK